MIFHIPINLKILLVAFIIAIFAFIFRVSYNETTIVDSPIRADAASYVVYAFNLSEHGVFSKDRNSNNPEPDAFWAPGYPLFLAAIIKTVGTDFDKFYPSVLYIQAFLGALTVGLVVILGSLFLPLWGASIAGILTTFSPHLVSMGGYVLTETLFSFFLMLSIFLFCLAQVKNN